jgi:hypothetical protein
MKFEIKTNGSAVHIYPDKQQYPLYYLSKYFEELKLPTQNFLNTDF